MGEPKTEIWEGWWESGGVKRPLELKLEFSDHRRLFGSGHDGLGSFQLGGSHGETVLTFRTSMAHGRPGRVFSGARTNNKVEGHWEPEGAGNHVRSNGGRFELKVKEDEEASAPSWSPERLELYERCDQLGTGGFGIVTKVRRKSDGKLLVWKELNYGRMNKNERRMMINEVNILREMRHPHIVRYYDTIIIVEKQKIYIVIEYCENGDLATLIENHLKRKTRVQEGFCWRIFYQIALALQACHKRDDKILHRDLKPANILLGSNYDVKVCDFGLATLVGTESLAYSKVGTPLYMSPEQMAGTGYTEKSDLWSLGCIVHELAALEPPFDADNQFELQRKIVAGTFSRIPRQYSDELHGAITWCLKPTPSQRPNIDELVKFLYERVCAYSAAAASGSDNPNSQRKLSDPSESSNATTTSGGGGASLAVGVGIVLGPSPSGRAVVQDLTEGGAAERSGIVARGDMLLTIDEADIWGQPISLIGQRLRGPEGSRITLGLARWDERDRQEKLYKVVLRRGWPSATGSGASAISAGTTAAKGNSSSLDGAPGSSGAPLVAAHLKGPATGTVSPRDHQDAPAAPELGRRAPTGPNAGDRDVQSLAAELRRREQERVRDRERELETLKSNQRRAEDAERREREAREQRRHREQEDREREARQAAAREREAWTQERERERRDREAREVARKDQWERELREYRSRYSALDRPNGPPKTEPAGTGAGKYLSEPLRYRAAPAPAQAFRRAGDWSVQEERAEGSVLGATMDASHHGATPHPDGPYSLELLQREIREHRAGLERVQEELRMGREREERLRRRVEEERSLREAAEARLRGGTFHYGGSHYYSGMPHSVLHTPASGSRPPASRPTGGGGDVGGRFNFGPNASNYLSTPPTVGGHATAREHRSNLTFNSIRGTGGSMDAGNTTHERLISASIDGYSFRNRAAPSTLEHSRFSDAYARAGGTSNVGRGGDDEFYSLAC
mmetsp:Transcript_74695/g.175339  ORF Transcript_74695/g.175339 Transcript_74695/m.175339 type:complete len:971 (-) Transcript_74695:55-2967(-)